MHFSLFIQLLHNKNFTGYVHIDKTNLKLCFWTSRNLFCLAGEKYKSCHTETVCVCENSVGGRTGHSQTSPEWQKTSGKWLHQKFCSNSITAIAAAASRGTVKLGKVFRLLIFFNHVYIHPNPSSGHNPSPTVACSQLFCVLCHSSSNWRGRGRSPPPNPSCLLLQLTSYSIYSWTEFSTAKPSPSTHLLACHIPAK